MAVESNLLHTGSRDKNEGVNSNKELTYMSRHKTIFLARIPKSDKDEFYDMCDMQAVKPAEVIRRMMKKFCDEMRAKEKRE